MTVTKAVRKADVRRKIGRPTEYSGEIALRICQRLSDGEALRTICKGPGFPDRQTVRNWAIEKPEFFGQTWRARQEGVNALAEKMLERADAATSETAAAVRVYVDAVKWYAAKISPKTYGDRLDAKVTHEVPLLDKAEASPLELARATAFVLALGQREIGGEPARRETGRPIDGS